MALIPIDKVADTIIEFLEEQRPVYETLISRYYTDRRLSIFLGRRKVIGASSIPAIEVAGIGEDIRWFACRVQAEKPTLEIDITLDNGKPTEAQRLEAQLVTLTVRTLASPPHLRPLIKGTSTYLFDSIPGPTRYDTADGGRLRIATLSWSGEYLQYLSNTLFAPYERIPAPVYFPQF